MSETDQPLSFTVSTDAWVARQQLPEETSQISYHSAGHALFLCQSVEQAAPYLDRFKAHGVTICIVDETTDVVSKQLLDAGVAVFTTPKLVLTGHLGEFHALAVDAKQELDLGVSVFRETGKFDLVFDSGVTPSISALLKPFGYTRYEEGADIDEALDALLAMVGEFDKPKYFDYAQSVCAHSRSELSGCSRCIDVCATGAIRHNGDGVSVDPYLCQGCGTCATVCPSGAMSYAYPRPSNAIERSREMLATNSADTLMLYSEKHQSLVDELKLDASVHALLVEEVTAYGLDYWLSMLAGHVQRIVVLVSGTSDEIDALSEQQAVLHELLKALGVTGKVLHLLPIENASQWKTLAPIDATLALVPAANHSTHNNKRQTIRLALDAISLALMPSLPEPVKVTALPKESLFGRLSVNTDACTLCMACVSTCPAQALQDGQDTPALKFIESNCVQCGLCAQACPESAIELQPQYQWDSTAARELETLHDDEPFHCITCHTPFATTAVISAMGARLGEHWMFQDDKAMRRLKMCGDCRVKDIFREDAAGIETHRDLS